ncbi:MAG: diaminopimelate epimerase [Butyricicoccus sp.]
MNLKFTKMHGCGNCYLYFNCFEQQIDDPAALAVELSDIHFGVGSDGIILICPSDKADARMRMFNADGSEGKMCGNGIRCVGKYLYEHGLVGGRTEITVDTLSGVKALRLTVENGAVTGVRVNMGAPILEPAQIPARFDESPAVRVPLIIDEKLYRVTAVSMGNPHCVTFLKEDVDSLDLEKLGPKFEHHPAFPERVNTEFLNVVGENELKMRVWERGSGETWACGTGACASAVASVLCGLCDRSKPILLHLRGGDLTIEYAEDAVYMTGPAANVFEGVVCR